MGLKVQSVCKDAEPLIHSAPLPSAGMIQIRFQGSGAYAPSQSADSPSEITGAIEFVIAT